MASLFHWSDTAFLTAHYIIEPITIFSNLYLIIIAVICTPAPMRVYSCLIITHSFFDILASFSIMAASPRFVAIGQARLSVFHGICQHFGNSAFCYFWNNCMVHAFSHSLLTIILSYIYRFYILSAGTVTMKKMLICLLVAYLPSVFQFVTFAYAQSPNEELMEIAKNYIPYDKYLKKVTFAGTKDYMDWKVAYTNLYLAGGAGLIFPVTYFLRSRIMKKLQDNTEMSGKTKEMHKNLLQVLTFQTISPAIFLVSVVPYALMSLNISHHPILENSVFGFCGFIPAADSFVNLYFIKIYWRAAISPVRRILRIGWMKPGNERNTSFVITGNV